MGKGKGRGAKTPKTVISPLPQKRVPAPRVAVPSFRGKPITWRFSAVDKNGPFAWTNLHDGHHHKSVIESLASLETMTEAELGQRGCHFIETPKLSKEARDRLAEIRLDDLDEVYSIRVTGKQRVFCVHREGTLDVLWFDPEHAVCPSEKKHT